MASLSISAMVRGCHASGLGAGRAAPCDPVLGGQILEGDLVPLREQHERLDQVAQLTDVAGPGVPLERGQHRGVDPLDVPPELLVEDLEEVLHEEGNVLGSLAQRRDCTGSRP